MLLLVSTDASFFVFLPRQIALSSLSSFHYHTDSADFFITTSPSDPSWEYIGTKNATVEEAAEDLSIEMILPNGLMQAVRVNFHYRSPEDISPCLNGSWDDVDDLSELLNDVG